jgi:hypothetical protein
MYEHKIAPYEVIRKIFGFRIPVFGFRIPNLGFRIPLHGFRIPNCWIPDSKAKKILDSGSPSLDSVSQTLDSGSHSLDSGFQTAGFRIPKPKKFGFRITSHGANKIFLKVAAPE